MKLYRQIKRLLFLLPAIIFILIFVSASGEEAGLNVLFCGEFNRPVSLRISSPVFRQLSQFSPDRTESLNQVLKHISMDINTDNTISETIIYGDQESLFSVTETARENQKQSVYSFDPEIVYLNNAYEQPANPFSDFLENQYFTINRLLDQMYTSFEKTAGIFPEFTKTGISGMNYREYGKAEKKIIIQFPSEYVKTNFPEVITQLCDTEESRRFVGSFRYKGTQRITLLYDRDEKLMYIGYSGTLGLTDETMRRINLTWRCLRSEKRKKDSFTLKTPAIKGYDKYNMTYERDLDLSDSDNQKVIWDMQIDYKEAESKKKIQYSADLGMTDEKLRGNITYTEKQNRMENSVTIIPELKKENGQEYKGTIEITNKTGKIIDSSMVFTFRILPSPGISVPDFSYKNVTDLDGTDGKAAAEEVKMQISRILIRKLLTLPESDTGFFRQDIPDDAWKSILQTLF